MLCLQYCAKEMQTKFGVYRSLFSRKFDEISLRNFVKAPANFLSSQTKFRIHCSENSQLRNFAIAKIRAREISTKRNFAGSRGGL